MGKAYTADERSDIKIRIMEAAIELYHENGAKTLNIRELAKRAGISPGGFYNFWPDKDSLILDIIKYRASQKLDMMRPLIKDSLGDPIGFLSSQICSWFIDLKYKFDTKPIYRETMTFLQNTSRDKESRTLALYYDYLKFINDQWLEAGVIESMDIYGSKYPRQKKHIEAFRTFHLIREESQYQTPDRSRHHNSARKTGKCLLNLIA